jgi:hypothetical protein
MGKVQTWYRVKLKLEVVQCAQEHGNGAAERKFDIDEMNIKMVR